MKWLNDNARIFLARGYLQEWQTAEERIREIADNAERILWIKWFSDKFYWYMSKGYYSLSSPVWSNYWTKRGLWISCFWTTIWDSIPSILEWLDEIGIMSKLGWWTASYMGNIRPSWSPIKWNWVSNWVMPFIQMYDTLANTISQWGTRRGKRTPYLWIDHWDIIPFLSIWDKGNKIQDSTTAVVIRDEFMEKCRSWDKLSKRVMAKYIKSTVEKWYPYCFFWNNVNDNRVDVYKDKGLTIEHSQLCSEVLLNTDANNSFVCCLSSINLLHRDEIKNTDAVETMIFFLDSVITEFISSLEEFRDSDDKDKRSIFKAMERAYNFCVRERALWLWWLWRHSMLQSKMIPFESREAFDLNIEIWSTIKDMSYKASAKLAELYWEPSLLKWYGRRNSHLLAIAPTQSSSYILWQVSQSIEPVFWIMYTATLSKDKSLVKNEYFEALLEKYWMNNDNVWHSIMEHDWSVQHLDFLNENEKSVFKTFSEINPYRVIQQAADRQKYIDQWQSLNLFLDDKFNCDDRCEILYYAWEQWIKTIYYIFNKNASKEYNRKVKEKRKIECVWCSW